MRTTVQTVVIRHVVRSKLVDWGLPTVLLFALHLAVVRRAGAEDRLDLKTLLYSEGSDRMQIISPTFRFDKQFGIDTSIKIEGIYNSISGATPTGAPIPREAPMAVSTAPVSAPAPQPAAAPPQAAPAPAPEPAPQRAPAQQRPAPPREQPPVVSREDEEDEVEREDEREVEREEREEREDGERRIGMKSRQAMRGILPAAKRFTQYAAKAGASQQQQQPPQQQPRQPRQQPAPQPAPQQPAPQPREPRPAATQSRPQPAPAPVVEEAPPPAPVPEVQVPQISTNSAARDPKSRGKSPTSQVEDERWGLNLDFSRRIGRHTLGMQLSYSTENDYESMGISLRDGIDFNQRNTTLTFGGAFTHDLINAITMETERTKNSVDVMVGLTQTLNVRTMLTLNFSYGHVNGYLSDPYKVVELNGELVPEKRPESKDKYIAYLALTRSVPLLRGSAELGYRWYDDSFGVHADTYSLAWYQKLGPQWIVRPAVRYYKQSAADFYAYSFEGTPTYYSSDYRASSFDSLGYGLKVIWKPFKHFSTDLAVERYEQRGTDGITPGDVYPVSTLVLIGVQIPL